LKFVRLERLTEKEQDEISRNHFRGGPIEHILFIISHSKPGAKAPEECHIALLPGVKY